MAKNLEISLIHVVYILAKINLNVNRHVLTVHSTAGETNGMRQRLLWKQVESNRYSVTELEKRPQPQLPRSSEELEDLQKLLHFPEEVALRLAETEYQLFYQVPPSEYLRHVTQDLSALSQKQSSARASTSPEHSSSKYCTTNSSTQTEEEASWPTATGTTTVQTLINRFNEVPTYSIIYLKTLSLSFLFCFTNLTSFFIPDEWVKKFFHAGITKKRKLILECYFFLIFIKLRNKLLHVF